jgi:hypothetical protein
MRKLGQHGNPYPDGSRVCTRYPLPGLNEDDRELWPWMRGTVEQRCGDALCGRCASDARLGPQLFWPDDGVPVIPGTGTRTSASA